MDDFSVRRKRLEEERESEKTYHKRLSVREKKSAKNVCFKRNLQVIFQRFGLAKEAERKEPEKRCSGTRKLLSSTILMVCMVSFVSAIECDDMILRKSRFWQLYRCTWRRFTSKYETGVRLSLDAGLKWTLKALGMVQEAAGKKAYWSHYSYGWLVYFKDNIGDHHRSDSTYWYSKAAKKQPRRHDETESTT